MWLDVKIGRSVCQASCQVCRYVLTTANAVCSAMQNLREAIAGYRGRLMHEGNDIKRNALLQVLLLTSHLGCSFVHSLLTDWYKPG